MEQEIKDQAQPIKIVKIDFSSKITKFGPIHEEVPSNYGLIKNVVVRSSFGMQKCKNGFCTIYFRVQPYIDWTIGVGGWGGCVGGGVQVQPSPQSFYGVELTLFI